jgi:predicted NBD/HSP70 family sugar kinase
VENETNLAALAEQRDGAARGRDTFVLLWLGGGTGAAVILDGSLRRGASGGAGEIGFLPVPGTPGLPSATDCEGGFHRLAAAPAVVDLAAKHGLAGHEPGAPQARSAADAAGLVRRAVRLSAGLAPRAAAAPAPRPAGAAGGVAADGTKTAAAGTPRPADAAGVACRADWAATALADETAVADETAEGVPEAQADGAEAAARFLDTLADRIALGVASVAAVLDPGCVVLGGEIGQAGGDALAARVEQRVAGLSPLRTEVRASVLGGAAVLRGALLTARDSAQEDLVTPPGIVLDSPPGRTR